MIRAATVVVALSLVSETTPARAQTEAADLEARQAALFEALSADPTNLDLMFAYAVTSIRLEDYEPAIATLERMLIFNPDLPRVRLELGVAYYRLGVYEVARFQFEEALAAGPPQEVVDRVQPFLDRIDRRTARHGYGGAVTAGALYSSNANLGPDDRLVRAANLPGGFGTIPSDADAAPDFGLKLTAVGEHRYDLRTPRDDAWVTSAGYTGIRYRREGDGDLDAATATTGPRLALDDEPFGLKARPFLGASYVRSGGDELYWEGGGGVEATDSLSPDWSAFGLGTVFWREFTDSADEEYDGLYTAISGGLIHRPGGGRVERGALFLRADGTDEAHTSNWEIGLRLSATRELPIHEAEGFGWSELPWRATVFAQGSLRRYQGADAVVDPSTTRQDWDGRLGARLVAPIGLETAIAADISYFERFSNIQNYDLDNFEIGLSFVKSF